MFKVGGSSYNNGIQFFAEKYSATFRYQNGKSHIFLRKVNSKETSKILNWLTKIPFIRSFVSLYESSKIILTFWCILTLFEYSVFRYSQAISFTPTSSDIANSAITSTPPTATIAPWIAITILVTFIVIVFFTLLLFGFTFFRIYKNHGNTAQYHGAEHKVLNTYYNDKELSLENCKVAPRISDACGTMLVTFGIFTFLMLKLITTIFNIKILTTIFFTIVWAIAYELFCLDYSKPLINWLVKISYWLQKNIFTREPTDLQLSLAIETFQLLKKAETGLIPKDELSELFNNGKKSTLTN